MSRPFAKYEGLGNDFVVLDAARWPLDELTPSLARALCDRHRGIGGDGVLWMGPAERPEDDARLVILNADGSRPEMCGNGVRCVVAWLFDQGRLGQDAWLQLETDAGLRPGRVLGTTADGDVLVEVDMGPVRVTAAPVEIARPGGGSVRATAVDVGNPHAVVFDPVPLPERMDVVRALEARRDVFPHGVNVEFVTPVDDGFEVRVHERGVGWTQACGTGACAVVAAVGASTPATSAGAPLRVTLEGGALEVRLAPRDGELRAMLRGPARRAFEGTVSGVRSGA